MKEIIVNIEDKDGLAVSPRSQLSNISSAIETSALFADVPHAHTHELV
jgi:hypothetical protein